MKTAGLKKVRWIAFALAALGILQTPFVIPGAVSHAIADHRLIAPFMMAFAIRVLFISFLAKIWWDTRASADSPPATSR
jgi:uncharacterized membrane protein YdjX (TVP38/TMEM64 family)